MEYLMLIYSSEERWNALAPEEVDRIMQGHYAVRDKAVAAGHMRGGNRLMDTTSATTVRNLGGKVSVTDGPFAETKEQLGGYYHFECDHLDQVIEYAGMLPYGDIGRIEIRPVFDMSD